MKRPCRPRCGRCNVSSLGASVQVSDMKMFAVEGESPVQPAQGVPYRAVSNESGSLGMLL